jgi:hypothetical protein
VVTMVLVVAHTTGGEPDANDGPLVWAARRVARTNPKRQRIVANRTEPAHLLKIGDRKGLMAALTHLINLSSLNGQNNPASRVVLCLTKSTRKREWACSRMAIPFSSTRASRRGKTN